MSGQLFFHVLPHSPLFNAACNLLASKKSVLIAPSCIYELLVKLTEVKVPLKSIECLLSKNPEASSLSAKCAIALRMMNAKTIQSNIKSSFPLIASQEIRFYESSGFIIFQLKEEFSFN